MAKGAVFIKDLYAVLLKLHSMATSLRSGLRRIRSQFHGGECVRRQRRRQAFENEPLDASARRYFRRVEITFRIDCDVMDTLKIPGLGASLPKLIKDFELLTINYDDV